MDEAGMDEQSVDEAVGVRIRTLREAKNWSQVELAEKLSADGSNWYRQTILKVEKGQRPLKAAEILRFAAVLEVSPQQLLTVFGSATQGYHASPGIAHAVLDLMDELDIAAANLSNLRELNKRQAIEIESASLKVREQAAVAAQILETFSKQDKEQ